MVVLGKIKVFFWRLYLDRLPTIDNLILDMPSVCVLCGRQRESTFHIFWQCKSTREILRASKFKELICGFPTRDLFLLLQDINDILDWAKYEDLVFLLWMIWNARN